jgi:hypothetical protein
MTRLYRFDGTENETLAKSKVKAVDACILYYLYQGRNAWHSTWVTQYSYGCMHTTLESAKESAERLRTQGSVFYIRQLPALAFRSAQGALIVTQINTTQPLRDYSAVALRPLPHGVERLKGGRENYVSKGAPISGAALSFSRSSRFWKKAPPHRNSVIVDASLDRSVALEQLTKSKLRTFKSSSNGGAYFLSWSSPEQMHGGTSSLFVQRLSKGFIIPKFGRNLKPPKVD